MDVVPLFSHPVSCTVIDVSVAPDLTQEEFMLSERNDRNWITHNDHLLDTDRWQPVKRQIDSVLDEFFHEHLQGPDNMNIRVIESWLNKSERDMHRGRHNHPNSYYSGVLYFEHHDAELNLYTPNAPAIYPIPRASNVLNSHHWRFRPEPGLLILFPSYIQHDTDPSPSDAVRHSLAFDTWIENLWQGDDPIRNKFQF